jgi:ribonuclease III
MKTSVALLIDHENVPQASHAKNLVDFSRKQGRLITQKAYAVCWEKSSLRYRHFLKSLGFTLVTTWLPIRNCADYKCMFDCIELAKDKNSPDIFVLVTGDGDYSAVIPQLISWGKKVIVVSRRGSESKKLKLLAHEFHLLEDL